MPYASDFRPEAICTPENGRIALRFTDDPDREPVLVENSIRANGTLSWSSIREAIDRHRDPEDKRTLYDVVLHNGRIPDPFAIAVKRLPDTLAVPVSITGEDIYLVLGGWGHGEVYEENLMVIGASGWSLRCASFVRTDEFRHDWDPLREAAMSDEDLIELYANRFLTEINPSLKDPFTIGDYAIENEPLRFEAGSEKELRRRVVEIVQATMADNDLAWPVSVSLQGQYDENHGGEILIFDANGELLQGAEGTEGSASSETLELLSLALDENPFTGWEYVYNDGPSGRRSGYNLHVASIDVEVPRPSAHRRIEALRSNRSRLKCSNF
jgi:hypothetical protein